MSLSTLLIVICVLPMVAAVLLLVGGKTNKLRIPFAAVAALVTLALLIVLFVCDEGHRAICSFSFSIGSLSLTGSGFSVVYSCFAAFMWVMSLLFSMQYLKGHETQRRFVFFFLVTLTFVIGVFLAADLLTLFLFFEGMSFFSYAWVAEEETNAAIKASKTYLTIAVVSGLVMLMGIFLLYHALSTVTIAELPEAINRFLSNPEANGRIVNREGYLLLCGLLLSFGFAAKAGVFPLHIWLPKAHPVAPAPASALLSGMLTKCGIYGLLLVALKLLPTSLDFGRLLLILGTITMVLGALLAVLSIDLKRIFACSSVSQIGFITLGIGVLVLSGGEDSLSFFGVVYHCLNHSLLKLILFLFAGCALLFAGTLDLTKLKGVGRRHPILMLVVGVSGLSLAGFPGTSGYISKTLLHEGIVECREKMEMLSESGLVSLLSVAEWLFLFAGGLTLAYMLKVFIALFVEKGESEGKQDGKRLTGPSFVAVVLPACLVPILGLTPNLSFAAFGKVASQSLLGTAFPAELTEWFALQNLKGALISLLIGILIYTLFVRTVLVKRVQKQTVYVNRLPAFLDLEDSVYRPVLSGFLSFVLAFFSRVLDTMIDSVTAFLTTTVFAPKKRRMSIWVGTKVTHMFGTMIDSIVVILNKTVFKKRPIKRSFVSVLAVSEAEAKQTLQLITGSVSFGLLLAAMGLVLTLLYLLF